MKQWKIGSLFSGYSGLDMGVTTALARFGIDAQPAWFVEYDDAPSRILAHHYPDVPNYGDITALDFAAVEPVEVMTGGFPCQDLSLAGRRAGMRTGTRSGLWADYLRGIAALHPRLAIIENVRGLLSGCAESDLGPCPGCVDPSVEHRPVLRALGRVLGDLASLGYDARWGGVRASDAGAPHERFRVFVVAYPAGDRGWLRDGDDVRDRCGTERRASPAGRGATQDADGSTGGEWRKPAPGQAESRRSRSDSRGRGRAPAPDPHGGEPKRRGGHRDLGAAPEARGRERAERERVRHSTVDRGAPDWGPYGGAIRRWEAVLGRPTPSPTETSPNGGQRLSPAFTEWMMGLPRGHVTDPAIGITRPQGLKALGNGVCPQQADLAVSTLLAFP